MILFNLEWFSKIIIFGLNVINCVKVQKHYDLDRTVYWWYTYIPILRLCSGYKLYKLIIRSLHILILHLSTCYKHYILVKRSCTDSTFIYDSTLIHWLYACILVIRIIYWLYAYILVITTIYWLYAYMLTITPIILLYAYLYVLIIRVSTHHKVCLWILSFYTNYTLHI